MKKMIPSVGRAIRILVSSFGIVTILTAAAPQRVVPREASEWCNIWVSHADKSDLPRALMIGDSISVGYFSDVEKQLAGKAYAARLSTSRCVGDPVLLAEVALVLGGASFDVIHINNGLHGVGPVSEKEYAEFLPQFIEHIRRLAPRAKLVWASSTPWRVKGTSDKFDPKNENVLARNRIAAGVMAAQGIPINDLYSLGAEHPEYFADAAHYNAAGKAGQGALVAKAIATLLK
jgi:hypothetical protein